MEQTATTNNNETLAAENNEKENDMIDENVTKTEETTNAVNIESKAPAVTLPPAVAIPINVIIKQAFEEVEISTIKQIELLPPYKSPTSLLSPIIKRTPEGDIITEGWDLRDAAKEEGKETIYSRVDYVENYSEEALALDIIGSRNGTEGGKVLFSENIRNMTTYIDRLLAKSSKYVAYSHGGERPDKDTSDKINITSFLAEKYGLEEKTVSNYRAFGSYLNGAAFDKLVELDAKKADFASVQSKKYKLVKEVSLKNTPKEKVIEAVSEKVIEWLTVGPEGKVPKENNKKTKDSKDDLPGELKKDIIDENQSLKIFDLALGLASQPTRDNGRTEAEEEVDKELEAISKEFSQLFSAIMYTEDFANRLVAAGNNLINIAGKIRKIAEHENFLDMAV